MICGNCNLAAEVVVDNYPKICPVCGEVMTNPYPRKEETIEELRRSDAEVLRIMRKLQRTAFGSRLQTKISH